MHYTICDFLLDLSQNSIEAGSRKISVEIQETGASIRCSIDDDGKGMDEATLARVRDPFFTDGTKHQRRKIGLGIPFLVQALEQVNGLHELESKPGLGTRMTFAFPMGNVDTPPLGDVPGYILSAMCFDGDYELSVSRTREPRKLCYKICRSDLRDAVGDLSDASAMMLARTYLESQES